MDRGNAHLFKYLREGKGEGTLFTEGGQYSLVNIVTGGGGGGGGGGGTVSLVVCPGGDTLEGGTIHYDTGWVGHPKSHW